MAEQILRREGENILNEAGEVIARLEANNIIKVGSGGGSSSYSTEEQVIGTWIDGKPIYSIIVDAGTNYTIYDSESNLDIPAVNDLNVKQYINARFILNSTENDYHGAIINLSIWNKANGEPRYTASESWRATSERHIMLYLEYTKTTD